jgi:hypothetical protein
MDPLRFYSIVGGLAGVSVLVGYLLAARRKSPEQRERDRRARINIIGRITDGTVIDVYEEASGNNGRGTPVQLLVFSYDVAGVTYEASQDVTHLRDHLDLRKCKLGLPASIKYDPQNPGNSIVIAEGWTGLRV